MAAESQAEVVERAARGFEREFGVGPTAVAVAPGRVNLIGEHTDYNDGLVLPMAIDAWCVCAAGRGQGGDPTGAWGQSPRAGARLLAPDVDGRSTMPSEVDRWARWASDQRQGHWSRYVAGVLAGVRGLAQTGLALPPLDVAFASSVPMGAGLSSSAALEVSVAVAACRAWGIEVPGAMELARLCQRAEQGFAGVPCGLMDQCASIMARAGHALLLDCRSMEARHAPMPSALAVVVVTTGVRHALASGEYARRRAECDAACAAMGVRSLRDATMDRVETIEDLLLRRRARHVVTENLRVLEFVAAMEGGDGARAGRLMRDSHSSLRDDYGVSCAELDAAVEGLGRMEGVLGARMTGGGFGGSAIALVEQARAQRVVAGAMARRLGVSARVAAPVDGAWVVNGLESQRGGG